MQSQSVSIVIPCLNEEGSIADCVFEAFSALTSCAIQSYEVIVVDNGSTDKSLARATAAGAKVVVCEKVGYGAALDCGICHSKGDVVVFGDGDGSYDFKETGKLLNEILTTNADLVNGNRFNANSPEKGAMPWSHRHIGNPALTWLLALMHGGNVKDVHCGLKALKKTAYMEIRPASSGFEYCSELLIRAIQSNLNISQVPITLRRTLSNRKSKLRSVRDGFRHLSIIFIMMYEGVSNEKIQRLFG